MLVVANCFVLYREELQRTADMLYLYDLFKLRSFYLSPTETLFISKERTSLITDRLLSFIQHDIVHNIIISYPCYLPLLTE